jgi:tetratricopeptide (TPR) repeat protein
MRKLLVLGLAGALAAASACAPKTIPAPIVTSPRFPEFIQPVVPPALADSPARVVHDRGWRFLQSGDLRNAERELDLAVRADPAFYPAEAAVGYLELARKDAQEALPRFDRALEAQRDYVPALVGRGQSLLALERELDALQAFEAAVAADPSLVDIGRRVEVLRFRAAEQTLEQARRAARAGRSDEAIRAYQAALAGSPDSAFLYREIAAVERERGDAEAALAHLRRAVELDAGDADSHAQIGAILEARDDIEGALAAYDAALAIEDNETVAARRTALQARTALARMPEQYRAIESAPQLTRADLAALIGVRFEAALQGSGGSVVVTDVRNNWAEAWIMAVVRTGVMNAFDNHTFQPRAVVRRVDLAQAIGQLLARVAPPATLKEWQAERVRFSDVSAGHLAYPAASLAVASGAMRVDADGRFDPSAVVTGAEALEAIGRVERMANVSTAANRR